MLQEFQDAFKAHALKLRWHHLCYVIHACKLKTVKAPPSLN